MLTFQTPSLPRTFAPPNPNQPSVLSSLSIPSTLTFTHSAPVPRQVIDRAFLGREDFGSPNVGPVVSKQPPPLTPAAASPPLAPHAAQSVTPLAVTTKTRLPLAGGGLLSEAAASAVGVATASGEICISTATPSALLPPQAVAVVTEGAARDDRLPPPLPPPQGVQPAGSSLSHRGYG